jgi:DNA-binding MarR family transcriptional regulator
MSRNKETLMQEIIKLSGDIFNAIPIAIPAEWLTLDLTVAQLRLLLVLHARGPSRMSAIAAELDVALSTATGIVDNLVKKGLVTRQTDPQDRRLVIATLSPGGQELINKLWLSGQFQIERLLDGLTGEQLEKAAEVARMLYKNIAGQTGGGSAA